MTSYISEFWKNCGKCQSLASMSGCKPRKGATSWLGSKRGSTPSSPTFSATTPSSSALPQLRSAGQQPHPPTGRSPTIQVKVDVICDLRQLPFAAHSIDLIVMAHVLEFHQDPHQILREVERVLIPGRRGADHWLQPDLALGSASAPRQLPRRLSLGTASTFRWLRLRDWLQLLGFRGRARPASAATSPPCDA
jgi:SAM-dependent methyltransferase